jgi:DNA-binding transcriptional MerR regulator
MSEHPSSAHPAKDIVWIEDAPPPVAACTLQPAPQQAEFTIGELAREFGVTLRALRFYENKGFIAPRREKNMRLYSQQDRARIAAILAGKRLGFTLSEIRSMIGTRGENRAAESLRISKEKCLEQIHMLEKQQLGIKEALAELWRIHAGLSAEIIRVDFKEAGSGNAPAVRHPEPV